jgi:hypothetical protein
LLRLKLKSLKCFQMPSTATTSLSPLKASSVSDAH